MDKPKKTFLLPGVFAAALLVGAASVAGAAEPAKDGARQSARPGTKHCTLRKGPAQSALVPAARGPLAKPTPLAKPAMRGRKGPDDKMPTSLGNDWEVGEELC